MSKNRETNNHRYNNSHNYREKQDMEELSDARIITKNLVYIIGLSSNIAHKEKLNKYEYLGQYGTIQKIVVNRSKAYNLNSVHGPSYSAYVTYSKPYEASIAILSLDDKMIDNHIIRASFGTTKYCSYFLKGIECTNKECLFLHKLAGENDIIKRGELTVNKNIFNEQHKYAIKIADIFNPEVKKKILSMKKKKTVFPSPDIIYKTITVIEKEKTGNSKNKKNSANKSIGSNNSSANNEKGNNKISPVKEIKQIKEVNKFNNYNNDYNNDKKSYDEEDYNYEEEEEDDFEEGEGDDEYDQEEGVDKFQEEEKTINDDKNVNKKRNKNEKNITTIKKNNKDIFNREKSRFDFCVNNKNNKENNNIVVPEHILNLINKKINSFVLTKYMQQKLIDKIFLNESIKNDNIGQNDEWTKFIYDNIDMTNKNEINNKDDLAEDLEHINDFIVKKSLQKSDNN
jgi:CCR4-NOT transcription complex subunit 4